MLIAIWAGVLILLGAFALAIIVAGWRAGDPDEIPPQVAALLDGGASGCRCLHCAWADTAVHLGLSPADWRAWEDEMRGDQPAPQPEDAP